MLVQLLQDYLRSSQGVMAVSRSPLLLPLSNTLPTSPTTAPSVHSRIVPLVLLKQLQANAKDSPILSPCNSVKSIVECTSNILINASSSVNHDATHSCPTCSTAQLREQDAPSLVSFLSALSLGSVNTTVHWSIPNSKLNVVVVNRESLAYVKFPTSSSTTSPPLPIFSVSLSSKGAALLNLHHSAPTHNHIIVTKMSNLEVYQQHWTNCIIAAFPDSVFSGQGATLNAVKRLAQWTYEQNRSAVQPSSVCPWVVVLDDSVCMIKEAGNDEKRLDICLYSSRNPSSTPGFYCGLLIG